MEFNLSSESDEEDEYLINRNIALRNYQIKLLEVAKKENSIIFLPTGAGKTLIAVNVLCSRTDEIKRPYNEGGKRAFFVCTTKVLVVQIGKVLQHHTKFRISCFTGDMNVDSWNRQKWLAEFEKGQVLVLTGDILKVILELGFIEPSRISLVVFDECHHAVGDHPYKLILDVFSGAKESPLLLGLSAVLLNSSPKRNQVLPIVQSLERSFRGKVITDLEFENVLSFAANPDEKIIEFEEAEDTPLVENVRLLYSSIIEILSDMVLCPPDSPAIPKDGIDFKSRNKAKTVKNALVLSKGHFEELGLTGGLLSTLFFIIVFEKHRLLSNDPTEIQLLIYAKTELNKIRKAIYKEIGEEESGDWLFRHSSPKLQQLVRLVRAVKEMGRGRHVSTIVFVRQRATAVILAYFFKKLSAADPNFHFVKADFVVGSSVLNKDSLLLRMKSEDVVKQFASRSLNLLISTNLLEEGIDVSACNVVISFDFPMGYPSYYQSRGRARDKGSTYYVFVKKGEVEKKLSLLDSYKCLEKELQERIYDDYEVKDDDDDVSRSPDKKLGLKIKDGEVEINGITAIRAVYRYCSVLPQDKYSLLSPVAWFQNLPNGQKKAFVQLPINCPLVELVEGEACESKRLAKRSAFLAVVKRLYEMGELDDDLVPRTLSKTEENYKELFPNYKTEHVDKTLPQPGTRKRKQLYKMKFAESLSNCLPSPGVRAYLHVVDFAVVFDKPELQRKIALYEILKVPVTFALISTKKLFQIFQFPVFLDMGQIDCNLLVNYDEIVLSQTEFDDIKACHFALFKGVARLLKGCQVFDMRNKEHSFFVAPVEKNEEGRFVLSWDVIRCDFCRNSQSAVVRYNPTTAKSANHEQKPIRGTKRTSSCLFSGEEEEKSSCLVPMEAISGRFLWGVDPNEESELRFAMTEADYKYFVVVPNYRKQDPPQCYVVNKICHDMSPLTPFTGDYEDYACYYREKYAIEITNMSQPLLNVSPLYNASNFNKPRNRKARRARERYEEFEELLVPELCDVIPFDKRFWLKAVLLPTVLNRIYHVFCVEEFRRKVVGETGLGTLELPPGQAWTPLGVDDCRGNEEEEDVSSMSNLENINSSLPLSKLKGHTQSNWKEILDPERRLDEVGLCDLEFYASSLQEILNAEFEREPSLPQNDEEVIKLKSQHKVPVPTLHLLREGRNPSGPHLAEMVQACTAKSANDIIDYERLEILGDSFLKFAVTLFLFRNYEDNEGILSALKGKIVGNRNLMYCGLAKNIHDVVNVNDFSPLSDFNPPLLCIPERLAEAIVSKEADPAVLYRLEISPEEQFSGVLSEDTLKLNEEIIEDYKCYEIPANCLLPYKIVRDKTVSDCVEAFIGVYLLNLGLPGGFEFLQWLQVLPKAKSSYWELMKPYTPRRFGSESDVVVMNLLSEVFYADLEETLNYRFQNKALLLEALTHPSFSKNRITHCYQRLELLGDAILDFLITTYVYENCGNLSPGQVTDIRSSLVNNITFASLVVRYELHKFMLSFSSTLKTTVEDFASFQAERNHVIDDNVVVLLEENDCMIAESVQVPKALGDLFESLAGAIYLDSGHSLEAVWKVYYALMKREIDEFTNTVPKSTVRLLQEICGEKPYYECTVLGTRTKVSCCVYYDNHEIKAHGFGPNKKEAKRSASKLVLNKLLRLKK